MTWYPQDYVAKVPMTDMNMRADPARRYPGRTYRFYKGPVVFPFGYGITYTTYSESLVEAPTKVSLPPAHLDVLKNLSNSTDAIRLSHTNCDTPAIGIHVDVKNTGSMDGTHTFLVFSKPPAGKWSPTKQLIGFQKVSLAAGSQQRVRIDVHVCKHLSVVDEFGIWRIPTGEHEVHIGDLQHSIFLQANLEEINF